MDDEQVSNARFLFISALCACTTLDEACSFIQERMPAFAGPVRKSSRGGWQVIASHGKRSTMHGSLDVPTSIAMFFPSLALTIIAFYL